MKESDPEREASVSKIRSSEGGKPLRVNLKKSMLELKVEENSKLRW
jgi:hypothetical protein